MPSFLGILSTVGLATGVAAAFLVYVDAARRDVAPPARLARALAVGASGFVGFLVPYAFETELQYLYFQVLKPRPIAVAPREWLAVTLAVGLAIAVVVLAVYVTGTRLRRPDAA